VPVEVDGLAFSVFIRRNPGLTAAQRDSEGKVGWEIRIDPPTLEKVTKSCKSVDVGIV
jgi:hypothetical protein